MGKYTNADEGDYIVSIKLHIRRAVFGAGRGGVIAWGVFKRTVFADGTAHCTTRPLAGMSSFKSFQSARFKEWRATKEASMQRAKEYHNRKVQEAIEANSGTQSKQGA